MRICLGILRQSGDRRRSAAENRTSRRGGPLDLGRREVSRIPYLADAEMTPRQLRRSQELTASRGGGRITGPGAFWVYNPEISEVAEPLRLHMERGTSLSHAF